jgi:hypothetical protein
MSAVGNLVLLRRDARNKRKNRGGMWSLSARWPVSAPRRSALACSLTNHRLIGSSVECASHGVILGCETRLLPQRSSVPVLGKDSLGPSNGAVNLQPISIGRSGTRARRRRGARAYWGWKSRPRGGRPRVATDIRQLIRDMSR